MIEELGNFSESQKAYEINEDSDEWKKVEFHLKSSIPSEIKINKIISVKNNLSYNHFKRLETENHLWAYGWYDLKGQDYQKVLKEMREKTFEIPPQGVNFKVGAIYERSNLYEVESAFILCKIIIGRSSCRIKQEGEKENPPVEINYPYQCYMYCSPEQSAKSQKMCWSMTKPYSYYIKYREFIEPLYCVFFSSIDTVELNTKSKFICQACHNKEADVYCPKCIKYFCNSCMESEHSSSEGKTNEKESHIASSEKVQSTTRPGKCNVHEDRDCDYYCNDCKRAICSFCRFIGSHKNGMQKEHSIEYIIDKFKSVGQSSLSEYDDKKRTGSTVLEKISQQIRQINQLMARHEAEINASFKSSREDFEKKSKEKKKCVFTFICCLRNIKDNLINLNEYFKKREKFLKENGKLAELAFIWSVHRKTIVDLINFYLETKKKMKLLEDLRDFKGEVPSYKIDQETYDAKKKSTQSSTDKNTITDKYGGFEEEQQAINFSLMQKTKRLILKMKEKGINILNPQNAPQSKLDNLVEALDGKGKEKGKDDNDRDDVSAVDAPTRSVTGIGGEEEINTSISKP